MPKSHEPIEHGSIQSTSTETAVAIVSDVRFPPGSVVPMHTHERTVFGVMVDGSFQSSIAGRRMECGLESAWVEPRGEPHANYVGRTGARVLAIQPDHGRADVFEPLAPMLADVRLIQTAGLRADGRRLARELRSQDSLSALAIDAIVVLMMSGAARLAFRERHHGGPAPWLLRARDALHDQFSRPPRLGELSRTAGVSASHLTHSFRKHFGMTPGEYVRHVRVQWAADELVSTSRPLSEIALAAGYWDQSHLTRDVRRTFGVGPGEYRASRRRRLM